jgi:hypothetical protein
MSSRRHRRPLIVLHLRRIELERLYRHRSGLNELEVLAAIDRDFGGRDPTPLKAREAGECCGLTTEERDDLGIRTMRAADMTAREAKAHLREKRNARNRLYSRNRRRAQRQRPVPVNPASKADQRADVVRALLLQQSERDPNYWSMVPDIIATVKASPAFAGMKDRTVRSRVHEILDRLTVAGDIESDTAWTDVREVRVVRWRSAHCPSPHSTVGPRIVLPPPPCPET